MDKVEFEFPDEAEEKQTRLGSKVVAPEPELIVETEPEIEVIDDTPEEDRGRKPMASPPQEPTDEELETYSKKQQSQKIREFAKGYHEERRAKEAALREREHALVLAKAVYEENEKLKGTVNVSQSALINQAKKVVGKEIEEAERAYKLAYESGDADALVKAQKEMTLAAMKAERVNNFKPTPLQPVQKVVQPSYPQATPEPDPKAERWQRANNWFGQDEEMTSLALAVHTKLINSGVNPQSDEYYQRLDTRIRQVFPEKFDSGETADTKQRTKSNVVASATRSVAPKKVTLAASEVNIAKKLGIPLERYAREVAKLRRT
jgi:hypothetical protein